MAVQRENKPTLNRLKSVKEAQGHNVIKILKYTFYDLKPPCVILFKDSFIIEVLRHNNKTTSKCAAQNKQTMQGWAPPGFKKKKLQGKTTGSKGPVKWRAENSQLCRQPMNGGHVFWSNYNPEE